MPVRILIIDDSRVFRSLFQELLERNGDYKVVASVWSGQKAMEYIRDNDVDLITLDVEMPNKDGLQVLRELFIRFKDRMDDIPVVMLSSFTQKGSQTTMKALQAGAFDFIPKPDTDCHDPEGYLLNQIQQKWSSWKHQKRKRKPQRQNVGAIQKSIDEVIAKEYPVVKQSTPPIRKRKLLMIGVSTGGPKALTQLLPQLCQKIKSPILIVQHMPPQFTGSLALSLDKMCSYQVVEANDGDAIEQKKILIAPGGKHMAIASANSKKVHISEKPPENGCRPSVSFMFRSAQYVTNMEQVQILVLTGMGNDGASVLTALKQNGVGIAVQDEESSVVWGMPGAAFATGVVDDVVSLIDLVDYLASRLE